MLKKKNPTLEDRISSADIKAREALDVFELAVKDLETAAEEAEAVVNEAESEVVRLREVRDTAYARAAAHNHRAAKIRELIA